MVRIVSDGAGDFLSDQVKELNIDLIPIHVTFSEEEVPQKTEEDYKVFYDKLSEAETLPVTSSPTLGEIRDTFLSLGDSDEEMIYFTMSSGLSSTYKLAQAIKEDLADPRIHVVDTKQVSTSQHMLVAYACSLRDKGLSAQEIIDKVVEIRERPLLFGVLNSLRHLKKGGRIPAAYALVGDSLKIKPVISLEGKVVNVTDKARGQKKGVKKVIKRFKNEPPDPRFPLYVLYTYDRKPGEMLKEYLQEKMDYENIKVIPVGPVVGTHVGPNGVGLCYMRKAKDEDDKEDNKKEEK